MIHILNQSPNMSQQLSQCLQVAQKADILVLVGDGVISACLPHLQHELSEFNVQILTSDVNNRGITPLIGQLIKEIDLVDLIVKHGNPITW